MKLFLLSLAIFAVSFIFSQFGYNTVGNTFGVNNISNVVCGEVDSCFTLTTNNANQVGAVWDNKQINLNYNFDASFCLTLGSLDEWGADGFAFVMRGVNSFDQGNNGLGLGAQGISPSVIVEFDTWQNTDIDVAELAADHTTLYFNGDFTNAIQGPFPLSNSSANFEDGGYHIARIVWNASSQNLKMFFDGQQRINYTGDIINTVFSGDNLITWGFTASTGQATNLQQICFPKYSINLADEKKTCVGDSTIISFYDPNITSYKWTFEDGTVLKNWNTLDFSAEFNLNDSMFYASQSGTYFLDIEINNQAINDSIELIIIDYPSSPFQNKVDLLCLEDANYQLDALNNGSSYLWSTGATSQQISVTSEGKYLVNILESTNLCLTKDSIRILNFCKDSTICEDEVVPISFYTEGISSYKWYFENGDIMNDWNDITFMIPFNLADSTFNASKNGTYYFEVTIDNVAFKDSAKITIIDKPIVPFNENELTLCLDESPFYLDAQNIGNSFLWSTGDTVQEILISVAGTYFVEITEPILLCKNSDTIVINSICETIITFPNVFSPNGDGLNETYELFYSNSFKWISEFQFQVFNRWGQEVYFIQKQEVKWDGKFNDKELSEGTYIYKFSYRDTYSGKEHNGHGNIQIVR
jgi:gliding motility-associated-like protein